MSREESLQTREQQFRARKWDRMFVSRAMVESEAFADLKTPAAYQVLFRFLGKRQWKKVQTRPGSRDNSWIISNNGSIEFRYTEANNYGLSDKVFARALDELIRVGFLDIAHSGYGLHKDRTLYSISDRWKAFGTDRFEVRERPRRKQHLGFQKGNGHGRNSVAEKKTTAA